MKDRKQVGIWLDYREAYIVELSENHSPVLKHLRSGIEPGVPKGGVRSKTPYGPQGGPSEQRFQEKRHHQEKAYFERIIREVAPDARQIIVFGPAEAKFGLQHAMDAIKHYLPQRIGFFSAHAMSENQIVAAVVTFYAGKPVWTEASILS